MGDLLVVPSARLLPLELQAEFGRVPSGLVRLSGRPIVDLILEKYGDVTARVVTGDSADLLHQHFEGSQAPQLIRVEADLSLGHSILAGCEDAGSFDRLLIHFADTWLDERLPMHGDVIYVAPVRDTYRFTTVSLDGQGWPRLLRDKDRTASISGEDLAIVGVIAISDPGEFVRMLKRAIASDDTPDDPVWRALDRYLSFKRQSGEPSPIRVTTNWFDLGHIDSYLRALRQLHLGERSFNKISIDADRGLIRKSSRAHAAKLRQEIFWYLALPSRLAWVAPRVFRHGVEDSVPWVELEYYGYSVLAEALVSHLWSQGTWARALRATGFVLDEFSTERVPVDTAALTEMYVMKTLSRTESIPHFLAEKFAARTRCGDAELVSLPEFVLGVSERLHDEGLLTCSDFTVIHGDLCLSNIVFDRRTGLLKVLDPRGSFGREGLHGDPRYDLAKLSHSLLGGYDFLVRGLFSLSWDSPDEIRFSIEDGGRLHSLGPLAKSWLEERAVRLGATLRQIRLLEATLFVSMVPLHSDRPLAQEAFLVRGLQIYSEVIS